MSPTLALLTSIAAVLVLLRLKQHPGVAVFAGSLVLALLVLPVDSVPQLLADTAVGQQFLRLACIVVSALTVSRLMQLKGMLNKLAITLETVGPRLAMLLVPAVIGLVPMPGGALVSATALKGLVPRMRLEPGQATFLNYWFRHICELSLPIHPTVIAASVVLSMPLSSLFLTLVPLTAVATCLGIASSYKIFYGKKPPVSQEQPPSSVGRDLAQAAWPVISLVVLVLAGLEAAIAFPLVLGLCAAQQRARPAEMLQSFRYGVNPRVMLLLYAVMLYKGAIESTGAAVGLVSDMQRLGAPDLLMLVTLPLLVGFLTGLSMPFVGIAFPLLLPIMNSSMIDSQALMVAYAAGFVGHLISPLHLCLVLSAEYFGAQLSSVYRHIVPLSLLVLCFAVFVYLV